MPKKAGMEAWKKKRRQEYLEKKEFRYYIFCEGQQTEPSYFEGFKRYIEDNPVYRDMVLIEIEPCQAETMRVIGMAEKYIKKNEIEILYADRSCGVNRRNHRCVLYGYMGRPLQCEWFGARCDPVGKHATRREHSSFRTGA